MWIPVRASDNKSGDMSSILGPAQIRRELTALSCVLKVSHMHTEAPDTRTHASTHKRSATVMETVKSHTLLCILFSLPSCSWVAYWSSYVSKEFNQRITLCVPGDNFLLTFFLTMNIPGRHWNWKFLSCTGKETLFFLIPTIISFHECYAFSSSILVVLTLYCLNLE